jgi:hypothetical protein
MSERAQQGSERTGQGSAAAAWGQEGEGAERRSRQARRRRAAPYPRFGHYFTSTSRAAGLSMRLATRCDRNKEVGEQARAAAPLAWAGAAGVRRRRVSGWEG